jgi:hypothetical protein
MGTTPVHPPGFEPWWGNLWIYLIELNFYICSTGDHSYGKESNK